MKQRLNLQQAQQLKLTPKLQQAIQLLQLSTLELQQTIQLALEQNPLLEVEGPLPILTASRAPTASGAQSSSEHLEDTCAPEENLHHHLMWQMQMSSLSAIEQIIASTMIDLITEDGYLRSSSQDIMDSIHQQYPKLVISPDTILTVLRQIQQFDPVGVGAQNLKECLMIQLHALDPNSRYRALAMHIVQHHMTLLAKNQPLRLAQRLNQPPQACQAAMALIRTLDPKPGFQIQSLKVDYLIPDILVYKHQEKWRVTLNEAAFPRLKLNAFYLQLANHRLHSATYRYLQPYIHDARWFIKSLHHRHQTLLNIARFMVCHQQAFFDHGDIAMKPLTLAHVAQALNIHESSVSRATTQKFIHTPRGMFELKYFFCNYLPTDMGTHASTVAIRSIIKQLIAHENTKKPLSDQQIASILTKQGIQISRRTVAKYRETVGIAPSYERKYIKSTVDT